MTSKKRPISNEYSGILDSSDDQWPVDIQNVGRLFQTTAEHPQPTTLQFTGRIPQWLNGNFYRNGPGKFEFGKDKFKHFFDPSAIVQKLEIRGSTMKYNSKFIQSRNFLDNKKYHKIRNPEVGTWAETYEMNHYDNGTLIEDEEVIALVSLFGNIFQNITTLFIF